jgi:hypothetical protein
MARVVRNLVARKVAVERPALNQRELCEIGAISFEHRLLTDPVRTISAGSSPFS